MRRAEAREHAAEPGLARAISGAADKLLHPSHRDQSHSTEKEKPHAERVIYSADLQADQSHSAKPEEVQAESAMHAAERRASPNKHIAAPEEVHAESATYADNIHRDQSHTAEPEKAHAETATGMHAGSAAERSAIPSKHDAAPQDVQVLGQRKCPRLDHRNGTIRLQPRHKSFLQLPVKVDFLSLIWRHLHANLIDGRS